MHPCRHLPQRVGHIQKRCRNSEFLRRNMQASLQACATEGRTAPPTALPLRNRNSKGPVLSVSRLQRLALNRKSRICAHMDLLVPKLFRLMNELNSLPIFPPLDHRSGHPGRRLHSELLSNEMINRKSLSWVTGAKGMTAARGGSYKN